MVIFTSSRSLGRKNKSYYIWLSAWPDHPWDRRRLQLGAPVKYLPGVGRDSILWVPTYVPGRAKNERPWHFFPGPPFLRVVLAVSDYKGWGNISPPGWRGGLLIVCYKNGRFLKLSVYSLAATQTHCVYIPPVSPSQYLWGKGNWDTWANAHDAVLWVIKSAVSDLGASCLLSANIH